jgi:hypothetical protein
MFFLLLGAVLVASGCGPKTMVPPKIDLVGYGSVGFIKFKSDAQGELADYASQRFLEMVGESQEGARLIELGDEEALLKAVNMEKLDREAILAIGKEKNISAVIVGNLDVTDVKPKVSVGFGFLPVTVGAEVEAYMVAKLMETTDGATVWTASAKDREDVASVSMIPGGSVIFDAENPETAYGELVDHLVKEVSKDLRVSYK